MNSFGHETIETTLLVLPLGLGMIRNLLYMFSWTVISLSLITIYFYDNVTETWQIVLDHKDCLNSYFF